MLIYCNFVDILNLPINAKYYYDGGIHSKLLSKSPNYDKPIRSLPKSIFKLCILYIIIYYTIYIQILNISIIKKILQYLYTQIQNLNVQKFKCKY
jgi:hypothetical protein